MLIRVPVELEIDARSRTEARRLVVRMLPYLKILDGSFRVGSPKVGGFSNTDHWPSISSNR